MNIEEIMTYLPHRYPMLLVDRITELEPGVRCVGIKNVTMNELFFQGHYPGMPIMPGVLILEAIAQASSILIMTMPENVGKTPVLGAIENAKFRRPVVPGDQLVTTAEIIWLRNSYGKMKAEAKVDGELAASMEATFKLLPQVQLKLAKVHPLSYVHPEAELADDVEVGPFCYVEARVTIGKGSRLDSHVTVKSGTKMGEKNFVAQGTVLGGDPQDRKYSGEPTFLHIGDRNVLREYVTIHRATGEGKATVVGNDCYVMAYCHLGHNVVMGDFVTVANNTGFSGHVTIEELVNVGGMTGVHQFVRIGKAAMVGGMTRVARDVPPFTLSSGLEQAILDINAVGLRRLGVSQTSRLALHKAVKLLFKSELGLTNAMETVKREVPLTDEVKYLLAFEERRFRGKMGRGDQP